MTSYSASSALGRENSAARTRGRRKVRGLHVEYDPPNVTPMPGTPMPQYVTVRARLIGSCGHTLRWLSAVTVVDGVPAFSQYLDGRIGRLIVCDHDDCRIPEHVYTDADCEYVMGAEVERRCTTRARWDTSMGRVCTRHRNLYLREGYIDGDGTPIPKEG